MSNNEKTQRPVLQSLGQPNSQKPPTALLVPRLVVSASARKQAGRAERASRLPRLKRRVAKLQKLGINRMQVAKIIGASYSGLHRYLGDDLNYTKETQAQYHAAIDAWIKKVRSI